MEQDDIFFEQYCPLCYEFNKRQTASTSAKPLKPEPHLAQHLFKCEIDRSPGKARCNFCGSLIGIDDEEYAEHVELCYKSTLPTIVHATRR